MSRSTPLFPVPNGLPIPSNLRQIDALQGMRALAVAMVAWGHCGLDLPAVHGRSLPNTGVFGIDIFFVISGFILSSIVLRERKPHGLSTMWEFLKRRFLRIFPIYWFFCLFGFIRIAHAHQPFQTGYVASFFLLPSATSALPALIIAFSWTLFFEMVFYYALAVLLLFTVRFAVPCMVLLLLAAVSLGTLIDIRHPFAIFLCNPILLEFVLGALIAMAYARFHQQRTLGILAAIAGTALMFYLVVYPVHAADSPQMVLVNAAVLERVSTWGMAAMLMVGGVIFWSPRLDGRFGRLSVALGNASYSTYLASPFLIQYATRLLFHISGLPQSMARLMLYQMPMFVLVMGLGWLCYDFIEFPMLRKLQATFLRKPA